MKTAYQVSKQGERGRLRGLAQKKIDLDSPPVAQRMLHIRMK
jgi:hypothetical protein